MAITLDSRQTKTLPIQVKPRSSWPIGYAVSVQSISPEVGKVKGGSNAVGAVARLVVIADPTPIRPSVDDSLPVKALDARDREVRGVTIEPEDAQVSIRLVEAPETRPVYVNWNVVGRPLFPVRLPGSMSHRIR